MAKTTRKRPTFRQPIPVHVRRARILAMLRSIRAAVADAIDEAHSADTSAEVDELLYSIEDIGDDATDALKHVRAWAEVAEAEAIAERNDDIARLAEVAPNLRHVHVRSTGDRPAGRAKGGR